MSATTFLECNGEAYFTMRLVVKNQGENGVEESIIPIDSSKSYKIVVFDQSKGLITYDCKITGFTMANKPDARSFVNFDIDGNVQDFWVVDTLKLDCSETEHSKVVTINISDIRSVTCYDNTVFEDVRKIEQFR